ncbi:hypothetical protein Tco_0413042 [Tanacetum coccineum]
MECKVGTPMEKAISLMRRSESVFGMSSNMMRQLPSEPSPQEAFEDLVMNFILDQEERVKKLKEYMGIIGSDFMQLSLKIVEKLKDEIRAKENRVKKIEKITRYPTKEDLKPSSNLKFSETLVKITFSYALDFISPKSPCEFTPLVTYPEEVEEIIGIPIEVEPLNETPLEDLGLNTCNQHLPLSSREVPSFDKLDPQPQPLPNCLPLDASLGNERGLKPPIKPHSPDSFRMKALNNLTIHTSPSSLVSSFHLRDLYCYYHPYVDDPRKHYGFKPGLLGQSGSIGVDFLNIGMIEND